MKDLTSWAKMVDRGLSSTNPETAAVNRKAATAAHHVEAESGIDATSVLLGRNSHLNEEAQPRCNSYLLSIFFFSLATVHNTSH